MRDEDIRVPASVILRVFNRETGASCTTLAEIPKYLDAHPEARAKMRALDRKATRCSKQQPPIGRPWHLNPDFAANYEGDDPAAAFDEPVGDDPAGAL